MAVNNEWVSRVIVSIEPGMAVAAEVKMGQRRVIEFLLSPLLRYRQESGREG